jgi:hypothetical protein
MDFMQVNEPSKASRIGRHDIILLKIILFGGDVAAIGYILYAQRRLKLNFISLFFERAEGLEFKN